ncbi:MAG: TorF family putative porin [Chthoniobacterales bacterium]
MKFNNASKVIALASVFTALGFTTSAYAGEAPASKEVVKVEEKTCEPFGLNVTLAYDSQYIFRGVNILGGGPGSGATEGGSLVSADINYNKYGFTIGGWYASSINETPNGRGSHGAQDGTYTELDLYLSYARTVGPVTLSAGYIYYLFPDANGVDSNKDTHEFNVGISTSVIPFVTPSLTFYYDVDLFDGGYLEFKLASSIPVIADKLSIDPYALVSYDFEYNSTTNDWNHFQAGVNVPYHLTKNVTISAYAAVSVALDALTDEGLANDYEVFGGGKLGFSF